MIWNLLAPGPSASIEIAEGLRGTRLGVVSNAYELAPWADFLAATDMNWWRQHNDAREFAGRRFSIHTVREVQKLQIPVVNSGVLALEVARRSGAQEIRLYGYDMHGTHFFGPYTNGLKNTSQDKRKRHLGQFKKWGLMNKNVEVVNCTPGSALTCFRFANEADANVFWPAREPEPIRTDIVHRVA